MLQFILESVVRHLEKLEYTIEGVDGEMMLREYLKRLALSVTIIKKAKRGAILLDGERVTVRKNVKNGMALTLILPPERSEGINPIDIPLEVLYEDEHLAVFKKPTNMPTHPSRGNRLPTLAEAVMARYGKNFVFRAITRLDKDTVGLVLVARNALSAGKLSASMKNGKIFKRYVALVEGVPTPEVGIISAPIRRESDGSIKRCVAPDGKEAVTEYRVIEKRGESSLCEVILHTGRTHQIRVHFAHIGHPLVSDKLYGTPAAEDYTLECRELRFPHPISGENITVKY